MSSWASVSEVEPTFSGLNTEWGVREVSVLDYGYFGGRAYNSSGVLVQIPDGTITLVPNSTIYIQRTLAGAVSYNTTGFSESLLPMSVCITDAASITSVVDWRHSLRANYPVAVAESGVVDTHYPFGHVFRYGVVGDGVTDDSAAMQTTIDNVIAAKSTMTIPGCTIRFNTKLNIWGPINIVGIGRGDAAWGAHIAGTTLLWGGGGTPGTPNTAADSTPAIEVGGLATSPNPWHAEGITLRDFYLRPVTFDSAGDGILFDGSQDRFASRLATRDIEMHSVQIEGFAGVNLRQTGNVFHMKTYDVSLRQINTGVACTTTETVGSSGADRSGQIKHTNMFMWSASGGWCAQVGYTVFNGGHIQGNGNGLYMGNACSVFGTHIEGQNVAGNVIGVQLVGRQMLFFPENQVTKYATAVKIGDGTATQADRFFGFVPLIKSASNVGLWITAGATRTGYIGVGGFDSGTVPVPYQDDRIATAEDFRADLVGINVRGQGIAPTAGLSDTLLSSANRNALANLKSGQTIWDTDLRQQFQYDTARSIWRPVSGGGQVHTSTGPATETLDAEGRHVWFCTVNGGTSTLNLPALSAATLDTEFLVKVTSAGQNGKATIVCNGADAFSGGFTTFDLIPYKAVRIRPNETKTQWFMVDAYGFGERIIDGWYFENANAALTNQAMTRLATTTNNPNAWIVTGLVEYLTSLLIHSNAPRTAGTLTATVFLNGGATSLTAVLDGTNTTIKETHQQAGVTALARGDLLDVRFTSTAGWLPTTADLRASIGIYG